MIVRCGRCGASFDVPGPGRFTCPTCGTANDVSPGAPSGDDDELLTPPPPPAPEPPSPRAECGDCGFSFIVGAVAEAPCPNCGTTVTVRAESGGTA